MSDKSLVQFGSDLDREAVLKQCKGTMQAVIDERSFNLKVTRARTQFQLTRNTSLRKAQGMLKQAAGQTATVNINWMTEGTRMRSVEVNGEMCFTQEIDATTAVFVGTYRHLSI